MTDQEIEKIARKAGISFDQKYHWYVSADTLRKFATMLTEKLERENQAYKERWRQS